MHFPRTAAALLAVAAAASCGEPDLVVYCSLDQVHSEQVLRLFEERTGLSVQPHFDVERNKTVGMVNRLIAERQRPRADVYWNNEIAHTLRLKRQGLTQPYASAMAAGIPPQFRDPEGHWTGFAARARVVLYRPDLLPAGARPPQRVLDAAAAEHARRGAVAAPLTGTTLSHFSVLSQQLGKEQVLDWLVRARAAGLAFGGGNADVMRRVCEGDFAWCLTDTDDAAAARRNGYPVEQLYPDQGAGESGTLLIPNTICMIAGSRHPEAARRFIDFVLSPEVEALLAASDSEQIPLRPGVTVPPHLKLPDRDFRAMEVDWQAAALELEARKADFEALFVE